jgi:hypothetical protein
MSGTCSEKDTNDNTPLKSLFPRYENGEIQQCMFEGKLVYSAGLNAPDAGTEIYDEQGKKIAACYYSSRQVDPMCEKLSDCEVIYRCENHITGEPAVDKYHLKK